MTVLRVVSLILCSRIYLGSLKINWRIQDPKI
jgi:hypothetical protein